MRGKPLLLLTVILSAAVLILTLVALQSSPVVASADGATSQMMGGMGNRGGMRGMMRDNIPPGVKPQDLPEPDSKGARLTVEYCAQCHNLASPSMHTAKEWKAVVSRMVAQMKRASGRGMMGVSVIVPSSEQQREILAYLEANALKPISPRALGSPNSPGAAAFRSSCSECHALPNPKLHSGGNWSTVVRKMQSYAKQMDKKEITDREAKEIESYLASQSSR